MSVVRSRMRARLLLACATGVVFCTADSAIETAFAASNPPDTAGGGIEEVIVTAERRTENVQNVPMSVTQLSAEQLTERQVSQPLDLQTVVPGLTVVNAASDSIPLFSIRGVSMDDINPNNSSPVGVYRDDVYESSPLFLTQPMFDTARVEVLEGPQGTLYGRNSEGGAINIISNEPTDDWDGYVSAGIGRWATMNLEGAVGGPISDAASFRVAGLVTDQGEGFQTDLLTGRKFGQTRRESGRAEFKYDFNSNVSILLNVHDTVDHSITASAYSSLTYTGNPSNVTVGGLNLKNNESTPGGFARLTAHFDGMTFTSITSFDYSRKYGWDNYDGTSDVEFNLFHNDWANQFSQEVRLSSDPAPDQMFEWLAGATYGSDWLRGRDTNDFSSSFLAQVGENYVQKSRSLGVYGHVIAHLVKNLDITVGGRYSHDTRSFDGVSFLLPPFVYGGPAGPETDALDESHSASNFSYLVSAAYHFTDKIMAYASLATGYKDGVYFGTPALVPDEWGYTLPESVTTEEGGIKSRFFSDRLQFDASIYHTSYKDRQTIVALLSPQGITAALANIPRSSATGGDVSLIAEPLDGLQLAGTASYIASQVNQTVDNVHGIPVLTSIPIGTVLPQTPMWSYTVSAKYDAPIGQDMLLSPEIDYDWIGKSISALGDPNAGYGPIPGLGASLSLSMPDVGWSVMAWGRNLTDSRSLTYGFTDVLFDHEFYVQKPQSYGITLKYKF